MQHGCSKWWHSQNSTPHTIATFTHTTHLTSLKTHTQILACLIYHTIQHYSLHTIIHTPTITMVTQHNDLFLIAHITTSKMATQNGAHSNCQYGYSKWLLKIHGYSKVKWLLITMATQYNNLFLISHIQPPLWLPKMATQNGSS